MDVKPPSLGTMIRSHRLGWGLIRGVGFMRVCVCPRTGIHIELCPLNAVPAAGKTATGLHTVWWENKDALDAFPDWLKRIRRVNKYIHVIVDEDGNITNPYAGK